MEFTESKSTRRKFYHAFIYLLSTVIATVLGATAGIYLLFKPKGRRPDRWVEVGTVNQFQNNAPQEVIFRRTRKDGWKVVVEKATAWIVRTPDNKIVAFAPQCTHLACAYRWEDEKKEFLCPCHVSTFAMDGRVLAGPAPRALDRHDVRIDGQIILLGPVKRSDVIS